MNRSRHDFVGRGSAEAQSSEPIAIIGASCRLPGAPDLDAFWDVLIGGVDAVTEIPDDRWNKAQLLHPEKGQRGKAYTFAAGTIGEVKGFDPAFFGISPREAAQMDPQQRLALELAHEAIEDSGIDGSRLAGESVGVFVGASSWDYLNLHLDDLPVIDAYSMIGITLCSISNRVSYAFDLRGPSFTVDTACSSSLVALHQACEAMRVGQVPMALVGGVSLLLAPQSYVGFCAASMLSPRGRCHTFDARADGYVRAEGGGFVLLKPLSAAIADGDAIRAVIRGTGVNSDGRTAGLSLPSQEAQAQLLEDVYHRFGLDPADLAYVEAHGTGTPAGDPIECSALSASLAKRRVEPLPIGSVKTNIGHLEAGSGMAGLLKAMLVAERGEIPPSLHLENPNPNIAFGDLNLKPVTAPRPIAAKAGATLIGVNSFGFGGTNAHAVIERAAPVATPPIEATGTPLPPLLLSARSEGALKALATVWRERIAAANEGALPALLRGVALKREQHKKRLAVPGAGRDALLAGLDAFFEGRPGGYAQGSAAKGRVAFVFSGNGSQWAGMAGDALAGSAGFRAALETVDAVMTPLLGWSTIAAITEPDADRLRNTDVAQPLLFAIQIALVMTLREAGITPDACIGHSVGEVAAAWASGALTLEQAARVICARSGAQQRQHGVGAMAVMGMGAAEGATAIAETGLASQGLSIAAHNSEAAITVAGPDAAITKLGEEAKARGWRFTRLDLDYAFHNAIMDPIAPKLAEDLAGLKPASGTIPFFSTVTGGELDGAALDANYWWRNIREPVLFAEAAQALVADGARVFVEIGPHAVLQAYLTDALRKADASGQVVASLSRRPLRGDPLAIIAGRAHAAGADMRRAGVFLGPQRINDLPHYPWQREPYWIGRTSEATDLATVPFDHPLLGVRADADTLEWRRHIGLALQPWIADHAVGGAAVMPAAALLDMALAAARATHPDAAALELLDIEIGRALALEAQVVREVRLRINSAEGQFSVASRPRLTDEPWVIHMTGRIVAAEAAAPMVEVTPGEPIGRIGRDDLYALADRLGLTYGPAFRPVEHVDLLSASAGVVRLGESHAFGPGFLLPPDLTDGALQGLLALAAQSLGSDAGVMPWRFGRVRLFKPQGATPASARLKVTRVGPRSVRADIALVDRFGAVVAELADCWFVRVALGRQARISDGFYHQRLVPAADRTAGRLALPALAAIDPADDETALLTDAFASAAAGEALLAFAPDGVIDRRALLASGAVAPAGRPLLDQLLRWLGEDGLASEADGIWTIALDELPPADAILRTLLFDRPRSIGEMALLSLAAETLPAMLAEGPDAAPMLPAALRDQFLMATPAIEPLVAAVAEMAAGWPAGRPLRVLELGARRGELTRLLMRRVAHPGLDLVAATSDDDLPVLADRVGEGARAVAWNPAEMQEGPFDLVVGLYPLTLGGAGIDAVRRRMAPDGRLIVAEPEPSRLWSLLQPGGVAALGAERWRARLADAGFASTEAQAVPGGGWPVSIVVADHGGAAAAEIAADAGVLVFGDVAGLEAHERRDLAAVRDFVAAGEAVRPIVIGCPSNPAVLPATLDAIAALASLPVGEEVWPITLLVEGTAEGDPVAAAISGARRVLVNEAAHVAARLVRIDPALGLAERAGRALEEVFAADAEQEVSWTPAGRLVPRLMRGLPDTADAPAAIRLGVERPGLLDSLGWAAIEPAAPGPGELAIAVKAAGLNFRDVMWAMGLLPDEALLDGFAGATLGLECAGVVTAVGDGVTAFAPGDRVMAFTPAALSSHAVTAAHAVMRMPPALDFAGAATVPVAFLTVAYSVGHLARLEAGETILIHGGAGGVGLAAIQYAKHRGARVFATAGSPAKRALLRKLGVDEVLDSRSLAFADEVMRLTGGEGVDVVLNSLSGEAMRRSLGLLKPFGRFLELGKRDFYENSAIGLRPFRHNVTYFAIDADQLPLKRPKLAAAIFAEISELFAEGALRALPHRLFDYADAEEAFRLMQSSGHVGKIVLAPGAVAPTVAATPAPLTLSAEGAYVVTGGLAGFGLEAARWLADHGATRLALLGRRGVETPGADVAIAALAEAGVDARAYAVDVADEAALSATLGEIRQGQGSIRGVVHAAVAMDDALLAQLDADRFARALAPKLGGADLLDRLTRRDPIDLFVLFSSVTTPLGNPGQANYVAANSAIEAVAERRHAAGLPGIAVQWGPIGDAGYLARTQEVSDLLSRQLGGAHLTARDALDALPALIESGLAVAGVANIRWGALKTRLPLLASPLFERMGGAASDEAAEVDLRELLASCTPEEAKERATAMLIEEVARIMKLAPDRIEPQRPLAELGMDSLMAVELRLAVEQRFGVSVPLLALSEGATLGAMAARILRTLGGAEQAEAAPEAAQLHERLARYEGGGDAVAAAQHVPAPAPGFAAAAATSP